MKNQRTESDMSTQKLKESLKKLIKPLLHEVTIAPSQISRSYSEPREFIEKMQKKLTSVCSSNAVVVFDPTSGKIIATDCNGGNKFTMVVIPQSDGVYKTISVKDGSERSVKINQSEDEVVDCIKDLKPKDEKDNYVGKAAGKNVIPDKKSEEKTKESDKKSDESIEVKNTKKQIDHKPIDVKDRSEEEVTKGTSGMTMPKKIIKQVDADSKEKVKLKADKEDASDERIVQKMDGTSKLTKQNLKEVIKRIIRNKLTESQQKKYTDKSFDTFTNIDVHGKRADDVEVKVFYSIQDSSVPDIHDRGNVPSDKINVLYAVSLEDLPEFGIKKGQEFSADDLTEIDDLTEKAHEDLSK